MRGINSCRARRRHRWRNCRGGGADVVAAVGKGVEDVSLLRLQGRERCCRGRRVGSAVAVFSGEGGPSQRAWLWPLGADRPRARDWERVTVWSVAAARSLGYSRGRRG